LLFIKKRNTSIMDRANAGLASLQQNCYAMNMLRSRLESQINIILKNKGNSEGYQELTSILELVKNAELILSVISERIESARYLDEFITIIDSAALSISDIRNDIEQIMPAAEAALSDMHDAIAKVSRGLLPDLKQEIKPVVLAEVSATAVAVSKTNTANVDQKEATLTSTAEEEEEKDNEQMESVLV
jgi:hypothetical protein